MSEPKNAIGLENEVGTPRQLRYVSNIIHGSCIYIYIYMYIISMIMMSFILCHIIILSIVYIKIHISGLPFILQQFIARNMSLMDGLCGVTPGSLCEQHRGNAQPGSASLPGTAAFVRQLHWALRAPCLPFWSWTALHDAWSGEELEDALKSARNLLIPVFFPGYKRLEAI